MPKNAVLINTARKEVIHEDDLLKLMNDRNDFVYISDIIPDQKDEFENNESFLEWVDKNLIFCDENFQNPYLED